jgi:hypothetical protein
VVLASATSALINELHAGWPWWVGAAVATLIAAVLAGWVARSTTRTGDGDDAVAVDAGGVYVGRDNAGRITTRPASTSGSAARRGVRRWIGPGAVFVGRDNTRASTIDTSGDDNAAPDEKAGR